jgi:hypothetical protein
MSQDTKSKRIKRLKNRANTLYKEMTRAMADSEEAHSRFHKHSMAYAKVLKQIELEQSNEKTT